MSKPRKNIATCFELAPEDPTAWRQLGIIYLEQGQLRQAYPLLKKSAELQPDDAEIQLELGSLFLQAGDYAQARDAAVQILDKQPETNGRFSCWLMLPATPTTLRTPENVFRGFAKKIRTTLNFIWH